MAKGKYKQWLTDDGLIALVTWARLGLTDADIAKNMDINVSTLYEWKKKYKEIAKSLTYAKAKADSIVENALYKRATGFNYEETTRERRINKETNEYEMVTTKIVTKMVVPDTTAQIYWLKNRKQNMWRDKHEVNVSGNLEVKEFGVALTDFIKKL
jgi:transposase-like protein